MRRSRETTDSASDAPPAKQRAASGAAPQAIVDRETVATASGNVQNRVATHQTHQKAGIVSRQPARLRGAPGITSRARATLGITAARAFPHAGRWESLATRAGTACWNLGRLPEPHSVLNSAAEYPRTYYRTDSVRVSVSQKITVTCRVRNNRIICQSSDPLEGMAITLNQWILLTARTIQSDAVAPNACRGTRLPSPQVPDVAR